MQSELKEDATDLIVYVLDRMAPIAYSLEAIKTNVVGIAFESIRWWIVKMVRAIFRRSGRSVKQTEGFTVLNAGVEVPMVNFDYKARLKQTQGY